MTVLPTTVAVVNVAALDVGGTNVKSGLVAADGTVSRAGRRPIDADGDLDAVVGTLAESLAPLLEPGTTAVAIAFPAPFDYSAGRPLLVHKFASLYGTDLATLLRERLDRPDLDVGFVNDAEAAAVGEAVCGAGRAGDRVLMITLGTGLGAAMTIAGRAIEAVAGLVIGDLYMQPTCSLHGATGVADDEFCAAGLARRLDVRPDELAEVETLAGHADVVREYGSALGRFLDPVASGVGADLIVLGGGAVPTNPAFADGLSRSLAVPWRRAELGATGPLIGAARACADR